MKPIKLIISAFGPYADKMPEIRFEDFEEKGLFLISGDTGAGKTTIFDAICYALYGKTSGSYRDTRNLRSEYAKDDVESYVDFYFSHQGRNFHVYRQPEYERPKKTGTGFRTIKERAVLYEEGQPPIEGITVVNSTIKELLNIDDEQFKQIAMIAQGEFWALLNAKTGQRTEILRTIFMTGGYKNIEYKLKDKMDANYRIKASSEASIVQHFDDVRVSETSPLYEEIIDLKDKARGSNSAWNINELLDSINKVIDDDEKTLELLIDSLAKEDEKLEKDSSELATAKINNEFLARLDKLIEEEKELKLRKPEIEKLRILVNRQKDATFKCKPVQDKYDKALTDRDTTNKAIESDTELLNKTNKEAAKAQEVLIDARAKEPRGEECRKLAEKIESEKDKYTHRETINKEISELNKLSVLAEDELRALTEEEVVLKEKITMLEKTENELRDTPEELVRIENTRNKHISLKDTIERITDERIPAYESRERLLKSKQALYEKARVEYEEALKKKTDAERIIEGNRAGILAAGLKEGEKCPVCGSVHHPEPACLPDQAMSEEEFKKLQKNEENKRNKKSEALTAAESEKSAFDEIEAQLRTDVLDCLENEVFEERSFDTATMEELILGIKTAQSRIKEMIEEINVQYTECDKSVRSLKRTRSALEKARGEESASIAEKMELCRQKQKDISSELSAKKAVMDELQNLTYSGWAEAKKEMDAANKEYTDIMESIGTAEKEVIEKEKRIAEIKSAIETKKDRLKLQDEEEEILKKELGDVLESLGFKSSDMMKEFITEEKEINESDKKLADYDNSVIRNNSNLNEAQKDAEGRKLIDIEKLQQVVEKQNQKVKELRENNTKIKVRIDSNKFKYESIDSQKAEFERAGREYAICRKLYNLVTGQTGNGKITLEQYIQAAGFDGIIRAANRRLSPMSEGQYELYRQEDSLGKKSNTFLDLEVLDNYTGHRRPVGNLSGGESFKASLSLALGLSDTVSSNLGGIQMDALFIDEGFGTLDKKSIDNAMEVLINLSESNKLVGVISHREELIENIPQQIKVNKDKDGSHIRIETGL